MILVLCLFYLCVQDAELKSHGHIHNHGHSLHEFQNSHQSNDGHGNHDYHNDNSVQEENNNTVRLHLNTNCGIPETSPRPRDMYTRIIGGTEAIPHSLPWQALVLKGVYFTCGGSLVRSGSGKLFVLTAAHCVGDDPTEYIIELGLHAWRLTGPAVQRLQVSEIIKHPYYNPDTVENDIAILVIATQPQETSAVHPVCLSNVPHQQHSDKDCLVSGWGATTEGGTIAEKLMQVYKQIRTEEECLKITGFFPDSMLCAGDKNGGLDSCQGDSGGPFVCNVGDHWELVGLVSWGWGCGHSNSPGVYVDVYKLKDWILENINIR